MRTHRPLDLLVLLVVVVPFAAGSCGSVAAASPAGRYSSSSRLSSLLPILVVVLVGGGSTPRTISAAAAPVASQQDCQIENVENDDQTCSSPTPVEIFRKDYKPLDYKVTHVSMDFDLRQGQTTVVSELTVQRTSDANESELAPDLELDGDESLQLLSVAMNGQSLEEKTDYSLHQGQLVLLASALPPGSSTSFVLKTVVVIVPETNTQLSGLYKSGSMYCTQCEPKGFRRITFFLDRPDNMAIFDRVRIEASQTEYPILLSNGNLVETGKSVHDDDRHYAVWSDPLPKPSYLFALVAGNLGSITSSFETASGRTVRLQIYSEFDNVGKLDYAMDALKRSMKWDEDTFGLEYDLDLYNIVAVNDFNFGAMENKGLNVFNTANVLANPETATDLDFQMVERVIAHEYFHNWTGNRVTCRDWFQLTLKEGLTVFRDHLFSSDMNSAAVKRIQDVRLLRATQFPQDAGPMSHPIRPESYISMDNFYTQTVYEKGAEVIQMYHTLLKPEGFRKGMDLYFERHDGSAVTCDDFRLAMAHANGVDLEQFGLWYSTPGTPVVTYSSSYDESLGTFSLTLSQSSKSDQPLHIPVSVGLLDKATGEEVVPTTVLNLKEDSQTFAFEGLEGNVVPSILRGFSAPVKLVPLSGFEDEETLAFLAARDLDGFNKWEAGQKLYTLLILQNVRGEPSTQTLDFVLEAFGRTLTNDSNDSTDEAIQAYALTLPTESTLAEEMEIADPVAIRKARKAVKTAIARKFQAKLGAKYDELTAAAADAANENGGFQVNAKAMGRRLFRNVMLEYLCSIQDTPEELTQAAHLARMHLESATCMTDKMAALSILASMDGPLAITAIRNAALETFYSNAKGDALVVDKWFRVQAQSHLPNVLERVQALMKHPDFTLSNPNRFRSLVAAFGSNEGSLHDCDDSAGYRFLAMATLEMDRLNPQVSARTIEPLLKWKRFGEKQKSEMRAQLEWIKAQTPLSNELYEVVSKALQKEEE